MKIIFTLVLFVFPLSTFAMAGFIQVDHTVQNIQGIGTLKPADMSSSIVYKTGKLTQSGSGAMQLYNMENSNISPTDYEVKLPFIPYYEYTLAGDCKGTVWDDKVKMCIVQWTDTGPAVAPVPRTEVTAPVPTQIQATPTCSQDIWSCGEYGICSVAGIQSRSCIKTFDCPNVQDAPPTTDQSCQPPAQLQPIQTNKQNLNTNSILEKATPKKSVNTPPVTKIETTAQKITSKEKTEKSKEPIAKVASSSQGNLIDQNVTSSTPKEQIVTKPSVFNRIFRWFSSFF